jgi:type VI secretion system secreted protein VgrG
MNPMSPITQSGRFLRITTPLGGDVLLVDHVGGVEGISLPFRFQMSLLAEVAAGSVEKVDPTKLLGASVTLEIEVGKDKTRYINGVARSFRAGPVDETFARFSMEIVPTLLLLDLTSDCRIFQNQKIPDILEKVLREGGVDVKLSLTKAYTPLDYCVQYRETDFAFVSRLCEQEGIFYYFEHSKSGHKVVLADRLSDCAACPHQDKVEYGGGLGLTPGEVTLWEERRQLFPGKWALRDYHFETPTNTLQVEVPALKPANATKGLEMFDFPGEYAQRFNKPGERLGQVRGEGEKVAKTLMEEVEATGIQVEGTSACLAFTAGGKFTIASLGTQKVGGSWVLTEVDHSMSQNPAYLGADQGIGGGYENRFICVPAAAAYRSPRRTGKPVVHGPQSARVVAEGGSEEIWPDKYGRVRVVFPWDRLGANSCWVRVAQQRAGRSGGVIWIPRVGDEVLVAFLEGDPDCPVIIGSVYNADNPVPYALPDNKTQSGIKTRSTKAGGADNFNELRFEDKKGSEEVFVQAEKDLTVLVKNDETRTVKHSRVTTIQTDDTRTVKEGNCKTVVEKGDQTVEISTGMQTVTVMSDQSLTIKTGNQSTKLDQGNQSTVLSLGNQSTECKVGNISIKAAAGKITIEAVQGIELKVAGNTVKLDPAGVTINGTMVKVEGQAMTQVKAPMTQVSGDGMLTVKGGITMIN